MRTGPAPVILSAVLALSVFAAPARAQATDRPDRQRTPSVRDAVDEQIQALWEEATATGELESVRDSMQALFDTLVLRGDLRRDLDPLRNAAVAARLADQLAELDADEVGTLLPFFREHKELADALALAFGEGDDVKQGYALLLRLHDRFGDRLSRFPSLVAALCVVHDRPASGEPTLNDPEMLFRYFTEFEGRMMFGARNLPTELMEYVVDSRAGVDELDWASRQFGGDRRVGHRYFDVPYDTRFFKYGEQKKITGQAYTLENLRRVGGVCVDQAYYAEHVGKAIGVPSTTVVGRGGGVGHAWAGYLEWSGDAVRWNFDEGRYDEFEDVRGTVRDPRTGRPMPDAELALSAEFAIAAKADREISIALTDAAERVLRLAGAPSRSLEGLSPELRAALRARAPRESDMASALDLAERAVARCPGNARAWGVARGLAPRMTLAQKRRWSEGVLEFCGERYPDFTMEMLVPMISSVDDPSEQYDLWEWAHGRFKSRPDLASRCLIAKGDLLAREGKNDQAWGAYWDVVVKFANDTPLVVDALERMQNMLGSAAMRGRDVSLYEDAWRRISRPGGMSEAFLPATNWYRVGQQYASALDGAGRKTQADAVRKQLQGRKSD